MVDSTAHFAAVLGVGFGAAVAYSMVRRRWWKAGGVAAMGGMILLNVVTAGNRSGVEHWLVLVASVILLACFAFAAAGDARTRRRVR